MEDSHWGAILVWEQVSLKPEQISNKRRLEMISFHATDKVKTTEPSDRTKNNYYHLCWWAKGVWLTLFSKGPWNWISLSLSLSLWVRVWPQTRISFTGEVSHQHFTLFCQWNSRIQFSILRKLTSTLHCLTILFFHFEDEDYDGENCEEKCQRKM